MVTLPGLRQGGSLAPTVFVHQVHLEVGDSLSQFPQDCGISQDVGPSALSPEQSWADDPPWKPVTRGTLPGLCLLSRVWALHFLSFFFCSVF